MYLGATVCRIVQWAAQIFHCQANTLDVLSDPRTGTVWWREINHQYFRFAVCSPYLSYYFGPAQNRFLPALSRSVRQYLCLLYSCLVSYGYNSRLTHQGLWETSADIHANSTHPSPNCLPSCHLCAPTSSQKSLIPFHTYVCRNSIVR